MPVFGSKNFGCTTGQPPLTISRIVKSFFGTGNVFDPLVATLFRIGR